MASAKNDTVGNETDLCTTPLIGENQGIYTKTVWFSLLNVSDHF